MRQNGVEKIGHVDDGVISAVKNLSMFSVYFQEEGDPRMQALEYVNGNKYRMI